MTAVHHVGSSPCLGRGLLRAVGYARSSEHGRRRRNHRFGNLGTRWMVRGRRFEDRPRRTPGHRACCGRDRLMFQCFHTDFISETPTGRVPKPLGGSISAGPLQSRTSTAANSPARRRSASAHHAGCLTQRGSAERSTRWAALHAVVAQTTRPVGRLPLAEEPPQISRREYSSVRGRRHPGGVRSGNGADETWRERSRTSASPAYIALGNASHVPVKPAALTLAGPAMFAPQCEQSGKSLRESPDGSDFFPCDALWQ